MHCSTLFHLAAMGKLRALGDSSVWCFASVCSDQEGMASTDFEVTNKLQWDSKFRRRESVNNDHNRPGDYGGFFVCVGGLFVCFCFFKNLPFMYFYFFGESWGRQGRWSHPHFIDGGGDKAKTRTCTLCSRTCPIQGGLCPSHHKVWSFKPAHCCSVFTSSCFQSFKYTVKKVTFFFFFFKKVTFYAVIYFYQYRLLDIYFSLWVIKSNTIVAHFVAKLHQLWPSGVPSVWFLCLFGELPSFPGHFPTSWHRKVPQTHPGFDLPSPNQPLLRVPAALYGRMVLKNQIRGLAVLTAAGVSLPLCSFRGKS